MLNNRRDIIEYCLTFPHAYEDYPFDDPNWTVMRRRDTSKGFAWIFERENHLWLNLKAEPDWAQLYRSQYPCVIPAYHMNKKHWNSLILDGSMLDREICSMIEISYHLCGKNAHRRPSSV